MPVYNGAEFLNNSIKSVLEQTYGNFELLCVDDSSTDNSIEILNHISSTDKRVKVFQKENGGNVPKSFNYVLPFIQGDFYFYMSQDDILSQDLFEDAICKFQQTGSDVIVPTCVFTGGKGEDGHTIKLADNTTISGKEAFLLCLKWQMHGFNLVNMRLLRDEYLDESVFNSDEFLTFRYLFRANSVSSCKGTFYYNRGNPNSITKTPKAYRIQSLLTNEAIYNFILQHKKELPNGIKNLWKGIMIEKIFWAKNYIKQNYNRWSQDEQKYVTTIYDQSLHTINMLDVIGQITAPRCFIKGLKILYS